MDQTQLQEKIALYYSKLPPNVQVLFSSMKWLETLKTISQKYGLNDKQQETLGTETTLVLLGIIHLVEYEEILTKELGLSEDSMTKMLAEIEESILKTVRPQLVMAFEANKKSETAETSNIKSKPNELLEKLPKEIQNIIKESNYQAMLYAIAKENNLNVEQMGSLEKTVTDLMVGTIHPEEFEDALESNLKLPLEKIRKLVNDVNEKIFLKIRESLKLVNKPKSGEPLIEEGVENQNKEATILTKAGIKMVEPALPTRTMDIRTEKPQESREEMLKKIEKPELAAEFKPTEKINPILSQKLLSSIKIPAVKTDHSLPNLQSSLQSDPSLKNKADPYREIPE